MAFWGLAGAYGYGLGAYGLGYPHGLYNHAATYPYAGLGLAGLIGVLTPDRRD